MKETRNSEGNQCDSDLVAESDAVHFTIKQLVVIFAANRFRVDHEKRKSEFLNTGLSRLN